MAKKTRRRPSASIIIACVALFVALGGSAIAATLAANSVTSKQVKNGSLKGKDQKDNTLTGKQVNESSLGQVPDAANLGGKAAANYLRSDACQPGSVRGYAKFVGSTLTAEFSTTGVSNQGNCSGGTVEARRVATGLYEVRFNGNPSTLALVSPNNQNTCDLAQINTTGDAGTFVVTSENACLPPPGIIDTTFTVLVP